ncbi:hypothetical protein CIPAW_15G093400 [Carya illinoinensis]|uniref:Reverse transcriptase domain-containing protein n=1 Tax=Carya illinoinensis TaxID=32201 RepID=A0A8T1NBT8_CARIL|nr:hypothetical protein CIPAW_15G093400 [Carya illinoinensis]
MQQIGFAKKWIELIMFCKPVTFSILINGEPIGLILPSRGIRQGDPLFPYLFLLGTEGLITLLNQAGLSKQISVIKVCRGAPIQENLEVKRILALGSI